MKPRQEPGYARCTACDWKFEGPTDEVGTRTNEHWEQTRDAALVPVYNAKGEAVYHGHPIHSFYGAEVPPDPRGGRRP